MKSLATCLSHNIVESPFSINQIKSSFKFEKNVMISIVLATRESARARFLGVLARVRHREYWSQGGEAQMISGVGTLQ